MSDKLAMLRNVAIVAFASYVESAIGLLAGIVIARTLGPADYGHYAYAVWLCGVLIMVTNSALSTSSIKFLAELRGADKLDLAHVLVYKLLRWQSLSGMVVLGAFVLYTLVDPKNEWHESYVPMLLITVVAVWARAGFWLRGALGKGFELFGPENIALAMTALLNLVLTATLAWFGAGVIEFFTGYAVLGLVSNMLVRWLLRRTQVAAKRGDLPRPLFVRVRKHLVLTGILITVSVLTNRAVEMTLLKQYVGTTAVAYFAIAGALSKGAVDLLAGGLSAVLLPSMARQYGQGGARSLARSLVESARLYWFMGLSIAGLGLTVADGAIHVLYGLRYVEAIPALRWQLLVSGLFVLNGAAAAALTADDRQSDRIVIACSAFVANAVLGYALIPRFGLSGAIASSVLTQCFGTVMTWSFAFKRTHAKLMYGPMSRLLLAAVLATAASWSFMHALSWAWAFVPAALLFVVCYLVLSVLLKTWRVSDYDMFAHLIGRAGQRGRSLAPWVAGLSSRFGVPNNEQATGG